MIWLIIGVIIFAVIMTIITAPLGLHYTDYVERTKRNGKN